MINSILKSLFIAIACLLFTHVKSQSTTFNYLASNLSTTACNVFSTPVPISGYTHNSWAGGVLFNTSNGLILTTTPSPGASAFYISYPFLSGNSYSFSITAKGDNNTFLKTAIVPNLNQYPTSNPNSCTADPNAYSYSLFGSGQSSNLVPTSNTTYNIPQFTIGSTTCQYMLIWVSGGNSNLNTVSISSITINNATPKFSLSPSTLTKACGTAISQTFTVANVNNSSGVTGYTWNLGANNNWLLNGAAAPATINTTTPSITLSANACVNTLSNVSATANIGTSAYNTNIAATTLTFPTLSIGGNVNVCNSGSFLVNNLTCSSTVDWSLTPSSVATITKQGNNATLQQTAIGGATLTAVVSNLCGTAQTLTQPIIVGAPTPSITAKQTSAIGDPTTITYTAKPIAGATYNWYANNLLFQSSLDNTFEFYIPCNLTKTVKCAISNNCGVNNYSNSISITGGCKMKLARVAALNDNFIIAPNPASFMLTISVPSEEILANKILAIEIIDKMGKKRVAINCDKNTIKKTIDISKLPSDVYTVRIFNGIKWSQKQIIVSRQGMH